MKFDLCLTSPECPAALALKREMHTFIHLIASLKCFNRDSFSPPTVVKAKSLQLNMVHPEIIKCNLPYDFFFWGQIMLCIYYTTCTHTSERCYNFTSWHFQCSYQHCTVSGVPYVLCLFSSSSTAADLVLLLPLLPAERFNNMFHQSSSLPLAGCVGLICVSEIRSHILQRRRDLNGEQWMSEWGCHTERAFSGSHHTWLLVGPMLLWLGELKICDNFESVVPVL